MKRLKLEVGKTYYNRRGKKVTIVEYDGDFEYPYRYKGSDDEWYTEDGSFLLFNESEIDLIKEVKERK
jgi:hypothetical protein